KLYIQTGKVKDVSKQIEASPKVELSCFDGEKWLRLSGTLVEDDRVEAREYMLDQYPDLKAMYDANDGNTVVYYFKDATAVFSSFTSAPEVIEF
ncbi:MAG: NimC/NimA family protein, partial [Firmicutes bacterium]|nr:NimC/NimA family protein [Bacillota bacterium]